MVKSSNYRNICWIICIFGSRSAQVERSPELTPQIWRRNFCRKQRNKIDRQETEHKCDICKTDAPAKQTRMHPMVDPPTNGGLREKVAVIHFSSSTFCKACQSDKSKMSLAVGDCGRGAWDTIIKDAILLLAKRWLVGCKLRAGRPIWPAWAVYLQNCIKLK